MNLYGGAEDKSRRWSDEFHDCHIFISTKTIISTHPGLAPHKAESGREKNSLFAIFSTASKESGQAIAYKLTIFSTASKESGQAIAYKLWKQLT